jgi:hypothetical protein
VSSNAFLRFIADAFEVRLFSKIKNSRKNYGYRSRGSWSAVNAGCRQTMQKSSSCLPWNEEEQMMKEKKKSGDRRAKLFVQRSDDEIEVAQRARVEGILSLVSSTSGSKLMDLVNGDFNAAINIRRCVKLTTRHKKHTRCNFVGSLSSSKYTKRNGNRSQAAGQKKLGCVTEWVLAYPPWS